MAEDEDFIDPNSPASRAIRNRLLRELYDVLEAAVAREPATHPITLLEAMVGLLAGYINRMVPGHQTDPLRAQVETMLRGALAHAKTHGVKPSADAPDRRH